ncbi:hypothetical protein F7Q91_02895 [Vibrio chagasii]|uniref:Uncharacterized protein n=1 Tax=Vibrio chagasii TaxID=170679 RepID=A0A7V7NWU1_9VIBR|nr:hypothetical protein [Vibrio chagasii]KAB0482368.1 hypothetical protein F7Q91_02895 [Vibrio chagasii]
MNEIDVRALREKMAIEQKCQKYPHTKIQVGAILYKVDVCEWDDGSTNINLVEWEVRSIRRKRGTQTPMGKRRIGSQFGDSAPLYVNVTAKIKNRTWIKQPASIGGYGWTKSISKHCQDQFEVGKRLPIGMFTTQRAALKWALRDNEIALSRYKKCRDIETDESEIIEWDEEIIHKSKTIRLLKSRIKKLGS